MFDEFKKFAMRGNVIDLAVGVVIGAAFSGIVTSLVNDIIMPPVGMALGGVDFSNFFIVLKGTPEETLAAAKAAKDVTINYGLFVNALLSFLITATLIFFLVVKPMQHLIRRLGLVEGVPPAVAECPWCRTEIRVEALRCGACTSTLDAGWATTPPD